MKRIWTLNPLSACDDELWSVLRDIRNECRDFMTADRSFITEEQQAEFRRTFDVNRQAAYLAGNEQPDGFLYMRWGAGVWVPTYGVRSGERGRGLGSFLIRLSQALTNQLQLEVRRVNSPAFKLYVKHGFEVIHSTPSTYNMRWSR